MLKDLISKFKLSEDNVAGNTVSDYRSNSNYTTVSNVNMSENKY